MIKYINSQGVELPYKIGDKVISDDRFISMTGFIEGEIIEIRKLKNNDLSSDPSEFAIKIKGLFKQSEMFSDKEYTCYRNINTSDFKLNPHNPDVNVDYSNYSFYCKAIFFTSQEEKDKFYQNFKKFKINQALNEAKMYGWKG